MELSVSVLETPEAIEIEPPVAPAPADRRTEPALVLADPAAMFTSPDDPAEDAPVVMSTLPDTPLGVDPVDTAILPLCTEEVAVETNTAPLVLSSLNPPERRSEPPVPSVAAPALTETAPPAGLAAVAAPPSIETAPPAPAAILIFPPGPSDDVLPDSILMSPALPEAPSPLRIFTLPPIVPEPLCRFNSPPVAPSPAWTVTPEPILPPTPPIIFTSPADSESDAPVLINTAPDPAVVLEPVLSVTAPLVVSVTLVVPIDIVEDEVAVKAPPLEVDAPAVRLIEPPSCPAPALTETEPVCPSTTDALPVSRLISPEDPVLEVPVETVTDPEEA